MQRVRQRIGFRERMARLSDLQFAALLALPVVVFLLVVIAYPLGYAVWISFREVTFFGEFRTVFVGLQNYVDVFHSPAFWDSVIISLRFTVESVILTLLIGLGIALVLAKPFRGKGLVRTLVILPWAVSRYGVAILFKAFWRGRSGFLTWLSYLLGINKSVDLLGANTVIVALAIGNAWNMAPLVAFFLLASMETIPSRLYDLAEIDRFGVFKRFFYVTLPYLRYTLFVFTAITTVLTLRTFDYIFTQTGGGPGMRSATVTYELFKETFINFRWGYGAAMSFYLLAIIVAVTMLLFLVWGRKEVKEGAL
jgi:multiple sugar transport system permease protein